MHIAFKFKEEKQCQKEAVQTVGKVPLGNIMYVANVKTTTVLVVLANMLVVAMALQEDAW